jgi:uncharacterized protein (DUF885 family)
MPARPRLPLRAAILVTAITAPPVLGPAGLVRAQGPAPRSTAALAQPAARSPAIVALLDEHVEDALSNDPLLASRLGDDRWSTRLPDLSPAHRQSRLDRARARLARLAAIDRAGLGEDDRLDAALLEHELRRLIDTSAFHPEQTPLTSRAGPQIELPQMGQSTPTATPQQREDYVARLEAIPAYLDQLTANLRAGLAAGRVPPRVAVAGTAAQAAALGSDAAMADPAASPFYAPFSGLLEKGLGDPTAARAAETIRTRVGPAYRALAAFLRDEYIPRCRESIGVSQGVDGPAAYAAALRVYTTTEMTAEQVHALGLSEVGRIRADMIEAIARTDWPRRAELEGDALVAAFLGYLRTDPRFYHTTAQGLLDGYRRICKTMDPELARLFGHLPRTPYGVREMPAFMAPASPTAYYYPGSLAAGLPGYFVANTYRLDQRPIYEITALALHESVPGHHLQIMLQEELAASGAHRFRTILDSEAYTVFVEGWALYAERLGLEVGDPPRGLYNDPYADFGRLTYEMWRACRLVVDTGVHAQGWTRQRAVDYMLAHTALSPANIDAEIDRYIGWPGQACGYKVGELKIRELRARAERELGERFDRRAFHDVVLGAGVLTLGMLEERVAAWTRAAAAASPRTGR